MSTQENGIPDNIGNNLSPQKSIVSTTNTNPIVVTVTAHGLTSGDKVSIVNHSVQSAANGVWTATVTGANTFTIPVDGTGFSAGGATGFMRPLSIGPTFAIPADGDALTAASANVALEANGDRTAWLEFNTGAYKLVNKAVVAVDDLGAIGAGQTWANYTLGTANTWTLANSGVAVWTPTMWLNPQDIVEIEFHGSGIIGHNAVGGAFQVFGGFSLFMATTVPGGSFGSWSKIVGSGSFMNYGIDTGTPAIFSGVKDIVCRAIFTYTGTLQVIPEFSVQAASTNSANAPTAILNGDYSLTIKQWRPTSVLQ